MDGVRHLIPVPLLGKSAAELEFVLGLDGRLEGEIFFFIKQAGETSRL